MEAPIAAGPAAAAVLALSIDEESDDLEPARCGSDPDTYPSLSTLNEDVDDEVLVMVGGEKANHALVDGNSFSVSKSGN